jgi:hypothetical protein
VRLKDFYKIDMEDLYKRWKVKFSPLFKYLEMENGLERVISEDNEEESIRKKIDESILNGVDEAFVRELVSGADLARRNRSKSKNIKVFYNKVLKTKGWVMFRTTSQYTAGKMYYQYIKLLDIDDTKYFKGYKDSDVMRLLLSGNVSCYCSCLKSDTMIKLLDGRTISVKDMEKDFKDGKDLWVYSTNYRGDFKPGKVRKVWVTGVTKEYIKVTLDNGREIFTTENHPYMLLDGSYLRADRLGIGQYLMTLSFKDINGYECIESNYSKSHKIVSIEVIKLDVEEEVYDIKVDKWQNFYVDSGVILHNCPDFLYKGFKYMGHNMGYGIFKENRFPKIRNPRLEGTVCKHLLAVFQVMMINWRSIYKDMKKSYYWKNRYEKTFGDDK